MLSGILKIIVSSTYIHLFFRCAGKSLHHTFFEGITTKERCRITSIFANECIQHSKLHHPNIVQCLGVYTPQNSDLPMLVMEYMPLTLTHCLEKYAHIPSSIKYRILLGVSSGLYFLHDQDPPIVHRDLTSNNVLLSESLQAKIADFGVSRIISADKRMSSLTTAPGATVYMPPEALIANPKYDKQLDIFSLGVLIVHVGVQALPAPNIAPTKVDEKDRNKVVGVSEVERRATFLDKMKSEIVLCSLARSCLSNDPRQRPSIFHIISQLEILLSANASEFPFSNTLEAAQLLEQSLISEDTLKTQAQYLHSQLTAVLEDVQGVDSVSISSISSQIKFLTKVASEMACSNASVVNGSRFVFNYKHPSAEKCLVQMSKIQNSAELALVLQPPVNMRFSGTYVRTIASNLVKAWGVAVSETGNLFVVDNNGWDSVRSYDSSGVYSVLVHSAGRLEFNPPELKCWHPTTVALMSNDILIVADSGNKRLIKLCLPRHPSGEVTVIAKSKKGLFEISEFSYLSVSAPMQDSPVGIAISKLGSVFVCDRANHRLLVLSSDLVLLRMFGSKGTGPEQFIHPWDVAFDSRSNLYISDCSNSCIKVFTYNLKPLRTIGSAGSALDNLRGPTGICIDSEDFLYVADKDHRRVYVFDTAGNFKMYFSGSPNGLFTKPLGVAVDHEGFVYVSDGEGGRVEVFT